MIAPTSEGFRDELIIIMASVSGVNGSYYNDCPGVGWAAWCPGPGGRSTNMLTDKPD